MPTKDKMILIPKDLHRVLISNKLLDTFQKLSYSNRKEIVFDIESAKHFANRRDRLLKTINLLKNPKPLANQPAK